MTTHFISDTHFRHKRIIEYSKRPFRDVDHMNEMMIQNWNKCVAADDEIYHLGDFGFGDCQKIFDRLNGIKFLILGNHDKVAAKMRGWQWVKPYYELKNGKDFIVLYHYGQRVWNRSHRSSIALYGHSHGSLPGNAQSLDVGVDCWDYRPVTLDEIKRRLVTLPPYTGYVEQAGGHDHHIARKIDLDD